MIDRIVTLLRHAGVEPRHLDKASHPQLTVTYAPALPIVLRQGEGPMLLLRDAEEWNTVIDNWDEIERKLTND